LLAVHSVESLVEEGAEGGEVVHPGGHGLREGGVEGQVNEKSKVVYNETDKCDQVGGEPLRIMREESYHGHEFDEELPPGGEDLVEEGRRPRDVFVILKIFKALLRDERHCYYLILKLMHH